MVSIPTRLTKISVTVHMVHIWVIMSTMLKTGVLRRTEKHDLQSYLEFMIQWEKNSTTVANFLEGKGVSLKDKKGNPTTKVPNPKFSEEPLMCHCWQQCMSHIAGGYFCFYGCVDQITGKQFEEGQCPVCICDCAFVCTTK